MADNPSSTASFTSWKLDILNGMVCDNRITPVQFRMAFRVMQAINSETRIGIIGDDTIRDEVPGCKSRFTCNETRKQLSLLGWWTVEPGRGGKASRYRFSDAPVNAILDRLIEAREKREERSKARRLAPQKRKDVVPAPRPKRSVDVVLEPRKPRGDVVAEPPCNVVPEPHVHLIDTPSLSELPVENRAMAHARARTTTPLPPQGDDAGRQLAFLAGDGSFKRGMDICGTLRSFRAWRLRLAEHGLTEDEVSEFLQEVKRSAAA